MNQRARIFGDGDEELIRVGIDECKGTSIGDCILGAGLTGGSENVITQQFDEGGHIGLGGPADDECPARQVQGLRSETVEASARAPLARSRLGGHRFEAPAEVAPADSGSRPDASTGGFP